MPLPGTRPIHPRWSEHHRPTATGLMTATCTITRTSGPGTEGPGGTWIPPDPVAVYSGPCRVVPATADERLLTLGENQVTSRRYQVAVRYDTAQLQVGDVVEVTEAVDEGLVGLKLRVLDVRYGSEQWERDLNTEEIESS
ncbi:DUF6093 family protein [Actinomadura litoris]|uniref:DUF6093 family protein n=1 Tax=Actinomadura litoris TaxID=2678616 RepID=UPI001FA70832|nr:DUF6093 family protein [Actinomadura litoris]